MMMVVRTTRRRQKKKSENVLRPFVKLKSDERKNIEKWKKNERRCAKTSVIRYTFISYYIFIYFVLEYMYG